MEHSKHPEACCQGCWVSKQELQCDAGSPALPADEMVVCDDWPAYGRLSLMTCYPSKALRSPLSLTVPCLLSRGKEGSVEDGQEKHLCFCVSYLVLLP